MREAIQVALSCADLDAAMAAYEALGFRLDMIMPADTPRLAVMSGHGVCLRLEAERVSEAGRAGMLYRDLIPGRLGGRVIASHIRIPHGGPVPDYVHYHHVRFQMIYCAKGWVRVVYEDQGAPFVMREGDCVLQPPGIRHRVLEASPGLEVIEVSAPAEHETWRDHELALPTSLVRTDRIYGGQRFVRHVAAQAEWVENDAGFDVRDTGIGAASNGAGRVRVMRAQCEAATDVFVEAAQVGFVTVLQGGARVGGRTLAVGDACVLPGGSTNRLSADACELLLVQLLQ